MNSFPTYIPKSNIRPDSFIGREKYLEQITNDFKNKQIISIVNFGGVGKSSLAREYATRLKTNNPESFIYWFNADSFEKLTIEYKRFADLFAIDTDKDFDFIIRKTNMIMESLKKEILFVFDNVENYDYVDEFLSNIPRNLKILLTTRYNMVGKSTNLHEIKLEPFSVEEGKEFIKASR